MKLCHIVIGIGFLLLTAVRSFGATVMLDYYSADGFGSGPLAGQPVRFVITLDGNTGSGYGFTGQYNFTNMDTSALLIVGTTQIFSMGLNSNVFMAQDEGLDYINSTIAGVHSVFSSPQNEGPVLGPFPAMTTPSAIDQYLLIGIFTPRAFWPYFEQSFINYNGQVADLSSLRVSEVPLPAALPLFATGLGVMGLLAWRRNRKPAAIPA
jgi:hypothetical protein